MAKQPGPRQRSRSKAVASRGEDTGSLSPDCHDPLLVETVESSDISPNPLSDHEISELSSAQTGDQMINPEHNGKAAPGHSAEVEAAHTVENHDEARDHTNEAVTVAATVGVVAVGAALFEVALLPGIALGVAAMLAPKYVPKVGAAVAPMFRSTVRGAYKLGQKTREMVAEAKEQVHDIVAEVHAEGDAAKAGPKPAAEPPHA
jgi:Protein of unknown function (DUF5132)